MRASIVRPLPPARAAAGRASTAGGLARRTLLAVALTIAAWAATLALAAAQAASAGPGETVTVGDVTVVNATAQPANVALTDGTLDVAMPIGFAVLVQGAECMQVVPAPNFARCRVAPGARVTLGAGDTQPPPPAPQPAPPSAPFPQPPMALARAGTGLSAERPAAPWALMGLLGGLLLVAGTALAVRRSRRPPVAR